jgi:hypothetical protein
MTNKPWLRFMTCIVRLSIATQSDCLTTRIWLKSVLQNLSAASYPLCAGTVGLKQICELTSIRIAHNWITDQYRRQIPQQTVDDIDQQADPTSTTSQIVDEQLEREIVRKAIRRLTPDQRQVVTLKFLEGWSNAEVAKSLNKPVGSVKSLQHRALQSLRLMLTGTGE